MMTLLGEIQILLERTYGSTGVNFEDFLLSQGRCRDLSEMAGPSAAQISDLGRVFLRIVDGNLCLGIHYDSGVVKALEANNPACGLNDENILPFMVFLEELDHALAQLSPKAHATFVLHRRDGCTLEEIGKQLGVSRPMVKKYLAKAVLHCRERFEK